MHQDLDPIQPPPEDAGPRPGLGRLAPLLVAGAILASGVSAYFLFFRVGGTPRESSRPIGARKTVVAIFAPLPAAGSGEAKWYGQAVAEFLPFALEGSSEVRVLSPMRLRDLEGSSPPTTPSAQRDVARRGGAEFFLQGEISGVPPSVALSVAWMEAATGREVSRWQYDGVTPEILGRRLDDVHARMRRALGLPPPRPTEPPLSSLVPIRAEPIRAYLEAASLLDEGKPSECIGRLGDALALPDFYLARYLQAYAAAQLGDPRMSASAASALTKVSHPLPARVTLLATAILALYGSGDPRSAIAPLESFLARFPDEKFPLTWLGAIEVLLTHEPELALVNLDRSLALDPTNQDVWRLKGQATLEVGRAAEALPILEKYLTAHPTDDKARLFLAEALRQAGKPKEARGQVEPILSRDSEDVAAIRMSGNLHLDAGELTPAREGYTRLARSRKATIRAAGEEFLGRSFLLEGKFREGIRHYQLAVEAGALSGDVSSRVHRMMLLGEVQALLGQNVEALQTFTAIRALNTSVSPELALINVLVSQKEFDVARKMLENETSRMEQQLSPAMIARLRDSLEGMIALEEKKFPEAVSHLEASLTRAEGKSPKSEALGSAYLGVGDTAKAEAVFRGIVESPDRFDEPIRYVKALALLGSACEKSGNTDEALRRYREALNYWGSADWSLPEIVAAREGVKRLGR
ncbi:MAG TPA: tetratricopeptide repeat protein [Candidatus Polarisedimenticolia bacterium]|nr:tetratricopeptide repeat protein [Candidatus Polarisedimenticolia bacterium]